MMMKSFTKKMDDAAEKRSKLYKGQRPNDDDYGYDLFNPIMMGTVPRCYEYLERLRTEDGESFTYERNGWSDINIYDVEHVMVDEYQLFLNGEPYKSIYMCGYGMNSEYAPKGLKLVDKETTVVTPKATPVNNIKAKEPVVETKNTSETPSLTDPKGVNDESIKALKELLALGVITQEEYDAKIDQISSATEPVVETPKLEIDYDELKKADDLYKEGVINEEEFKQEVANIVGLNNTAASPQNAEEKGGIISWAKKNIAAVIVIALLAAALAAIGPKYATMQSEITSLNNKIEEQSKTIDEKVATISSLTNQKIELGKYKSAVLDFYLDHAVLTIEGNSYYHRYGCPTLPDRYSYRLFNVESAKGQGYIQCPTCFGPSQEAYCEKNLY